ncbi:acyl-CoA thioesterase [Clostridium sp. DL1XJH146]
MYTSVTEIKVRYAETDKMGIVYHSNYYIYFEEGREDLIAYTGITYKGLEDAGVMMPLIETHCKYYEGAEYNDMLVMDTFLEKITPVKAIINYVVRKEKNDNLVVKGSTVQTFVDSETFKIINLKKTKPEIWDRVQKLL